MSTPRYNSEARVVGVSGNIVAIESDAPIMNNEVAYIHVGEERLKAEVLRVFGNKADMQVFEDTQGVSVGDPVDLTKEMLPAMLGPGLLGTCVRRTPKPAARVGRTRRLLSAPRQHGSRAFE